LPIREAQTGDTVRVVTYWASSDLTTVHLALQSPHGETLAEQAIPISIGAHERAQADLVVAPGTPVSELQVVAQARLASAAIGKIHVEPRALDAGASTVANPLDVRLGPSIRLMGYDLARREVRAGDRVPLSLFWQADDSLTTSYTVFVHLLGAQYNPAQNNLLWGQVDRLPQDGKLPTTAWPRGVLVRDEYAIPIQPNAPPGRYQIEVGLYDAATGTRLRVFGANGNEAGDSVIVGNVEVK
jgi:hypothetical protein